MAPAHAGGRMGGCETHSADLRTHPASPTHPRPRQPTISRLFLAPNHRPPLARVKLVRPRPRPRGRYRCGRSSLTRGRAAARTTGSCEESQQKVAPASPATTAGHRASPPRPLDKRFPHGRAGDLAAQATVNVGANSRTESAGRIAAPGHSPSRWVISPGLGPSAMGACMVSQTGFPGQARTIDLCDGAGGPRTDPGQVRSGLSDGDRRVEAPGAVH
jgi:hypothetical protein